MPGRPGGVQLRRRCSCGRSVGGAYGGEVAADGHPRLRSAKGAIDDGDGRWQRRVGDPPAPSALSLVKPGRGAAAVAKQARPPWPPARPARGERELTFEGRAACRRRQELPAATASLSRAIRTLPPTGSESAGRAVVQEGQHRESARVGVAEVSVRSYHVGRPVDARILAGAVERSPRGGVERLDVAEWRPRFPAGRRSARCGASVVRRTVPRLQMARPPARHDVEAAQPRLDARRFDSPTGVRLPRKPAVAASTRGQAASTLLAPHGADILPSGPSSPAGGPHAAGWEGQRAVHQVAVRSGHRHLASGRLMKNQTRLVGGPHGRRPGRRRRARRPGRALPRAGGARRVET